MQTSGFIIQSNFFASFFFYFNASHEQNMASTSTTECDTEAPAA